MIHAYISLIGRIQRELEDLERTVNRAEMLLAKVKTSGDDAYLDGIALNLHSFYVGLEHIFEAIAVECEQSTPGGAHWHRDLLQQMAAGIPGVRPPVLEPETRDALGQYLGFRHLVRNVYAFRLEPRRIEQLVNDLRPAYERVQKDITHFITFLQALAQADDGADE